VFVLWAPYLYDALACGGKVLANGWGIACQLGLLARPQGQPSIADGW
jgi:hypothetical protein